MNITHNPESTSGLGSLKKSVARALLVGGFGLAVMGLGAGIANADPPPTDGSSQPGVASAPVEPTDGGSNQPGAPSTPVAQANPGDLSQMQQLQIQMSQQQYDQAMEIASNVMKEQAGSGSAIVQKLKP
jgi:L,D-peptidoglycan transpeptidase YkuD (ErfK/YbiS/YcfS/YnhG family)